MYPYQPPPKRPDQTARILIIGGLAIAALAVAAFGAAASGLLKLPPHQGTSPAASAAAPTTHPTLAKYARVQDEMALAEVENIIGSPGTEVSHSGPFSTYRWEAPHNGRMVVSLRDGRVVSRAQFELR